MSEDIDLGLKASGLQFPDAGERGESAGLVEVGQSASAAAFADVEDLEIAGIDVGEDVVCEFVAQLRADTRYSWRRRFHSSVLRDLTEASR